MCIRDSHNADPVDGIIGADVLKKGKAIIDYEKKYLYLKLKEVSLPEDS